MAPLGFAVWVMYIVPVGLCLFAPSARVPVLVAAGCTLLLAIGYALSPPGVEPLFARINRLIGVVAVWSVAVIGYHFIQTRLRVQRLTWLNEAVSRVAQRMLEERSSADVAASALAILAQALPVAVGAIYLRRNEGLVRVATWAFDEGDAPAELQLGQGLLGQAVTEKRALVLRSVSDSYLRVRSTLGGEPARAIVVAPFAADGSADGAIELGLTDPNAVDDALELATRVSNAIGMALRSASYRERLQELLEETQRQSELLVAQQEELKVSNEELEEQSRALRESQARLENQAAELEQANVQLEEQTQRQERQRRELVAAQSTLRNSARELERSSRYKSEFLANMSHELRTPLNSSMILSKLLADNKDGNLTAEQVRYAQIIRSANNDLLALINDILDLSKIESGHVDLDLQPVDPRIEIDSLQQAFGPLALERGLTFRTEVGPDVPSSIVTDSMRLQQILKNLLSNAFKFTEQGEVVLSVSSTDGRIAFAVRDTGIGIAKEQQSIIFEAFRQADGTTSRKYGGTGLGLSICRELARLLGGEVTVDSAAGKGSTFTLSLPLGDSARETAAPATQVDGAAGGTSEDAHAPEVMPPTHSTPQRVILVVEHDEHFAATLAELAEELDFECVVTRNPAEALALARDLHPSAILLERALPDDNASNLLARLRRDRATRSIPVHLVTASSQSGDGAAAGAARHALKPAARDELVDTLRQLRDRSAQPMRRVLVVEDDEAASGEIARTLAAADIRTVLVATVAGALEQLAGVTGSTFDGVVLDLALPDGTGYELLSRMAEGGDYAFPPVVIHTGRALTPQEEQQLRRYSNSIIIKGPRSSQRLLDEVTLFLHRVEADLPPTQRRVQPESKARDSSFEGRVLLLAEDDVRNVFSLSRVFEPLGAKMEIARNGLEALAALARRSDIDLVLMDVMMPEMDGLTAMREIRKNPKHQGLPIIALTAKAMADDRQRCLEAGANDYVAKPIDVDKLVSLVRVWMPR